MNLRNLRLFALTVLTAALLLPVLPVSAQPQPQTFPTLDDALRSGALLSGSNGPRNINWIDGGDRFSYSTVNAQTRRNEIRAFTPANQRDELIFDGQNLLFPGTTTPFTYDSFQWAGDAKHLLFKTNFRPIYRHSGIADYYFYALSDQSLQLVARDAGTAELSPDGSRIGFERNGDMYVYEFATAQEVRLTRDAREHVFNGRFGWVYEEEFTLAQAWSWSNDSRYIAFWQEDESQVPIFQMTDYAGQHAEYVQIRYPKVGDVNPSVRIGVVDVQTGDRVWLDTETPSDSYIPRIYWTADPGKLAVVHLSRDQRTLQLFFFDVRSGVRTLVMEETSTTWIDVMNFFEGVNHLFFFPTDAREFYWVSDRDGYRHLYRYNYDGRQLNQVTLGEWDVTNIYAFDRRRNLVYYGSTEASPLERHLYVTNVNGRNKRRITQDAGRHIIDMAPNAQYFIDRWSNTSTPTQVVLRKSDGSALLQFEDNAQVRENIQRIAYQPRELTSFVTSDGQKLDVLLIKPYNFDPAQQYPVVLDIYGGPGSQSVYNQFETSTWRQYLAQQGVIIASVNNRGSSGYGRDFEKIVYRNLGYWEAFDYNETATWLAAQPFVDASKMTIRGHSYGGYMTLYTMTAWPDRFHKGISAAPVSDWRLYDTIYTERYMGLLHDNTSGYIESSPTTRAGNLKGRLLLVHSSMDENVHVQHTFQFAKALIQNRIDHDLRIFPPGAHSVSWDAPSYLYLMNLYTRFILE